MYRNDTVWFALFILTTPFGLLAFGLLEGIGVRGILTVVLVIAAVIALYAGVYHLLTRTPHT
ncbi:MAG TPA: hypothetical protein VI893_04940 [Thermoplasmata archaeon]|nr:hypothetical protein [Thermoplasmata archaeon]